MPAPLTLEVVAGAGRQLTLSWSPVADPRLDHYQVHQRTGSGALVPLAAVAAPATGLVVAQLQPGERYAFAVAAVDTAGAASATGPEAAATVPSTPQTAVPLGTDGAPNGYYEYLPPGFGDGAPRPLLVFWHGFGENGDGRFALDRLLANGPPHLIQVGAWPASRPFIVLSPQNGLNCPTGGQIDAFLTWALARYPVDPKQVYLTGLSCGAIGSWDYLGTFGDAVVAAALLVAGQPGTAWERAGCDLGRVALTAVHGTADPIVPFAPEAAVMASLAACPAPPRRALRFIAVQGGGHDVWTGTYSGTLGAVGDAYAWLLANAKP